MKFKNKLRFKKGYFAREKLIYFLLILATAAIVGRLFFLQVVAASDLKAKGIALRTSDQKILPERGKILDAQGKVLAQSIPVKEVHIDPKALNESINRKQTKWTKEEIAKNLGEILEIEPDSILQKLDRDNLMYASLKHQVELSKVEEIRKLNIPGIGFTDEQKRIYPMENLAASILGIVNLDGHGVEGVEAYYDEQLYGTPGYSSSQRGTGLSSVLDSINPNQPPQKGSDITLTLNSTVQYVIEQQLDNLMELTNADNISILAMDPMTGKILGMGCRPFFNPNDYQSTNPEHRRNLSISMAYEPGSTFKIITGAAAMEEGIVAPDTEIDDPGYYKVGPNVIRNWDSYFRSHGLITFTRGMEVSSNVIMAKLGMELGKDRLYSYLNAFGFGQKTGIDISGEQSGLLVPKNKVRDIDIVTMSFGQANLVTQVQLLTAISSVANGGTLYKPYIVEKIINPDGTEVINAPTPIRQVISKSTARQMTEVLQSVVDNGTGAPAQIPGIKVAGKTGTAQKVDPVKGGYSSTDFIASFTAYAPADNPKIAVLVTIDTPRGDSHHGGTLGGPVAKAIIETALEQYGIPVDSGTESQVTELPESTFTRPRPQEVEPERAPLNGETVVPDLTGLTIRQAGETLSKAELHFNFSGSGLVNSQNPLPGTVVNRGSTVTVKFAPLENNNSPPETP